MAQENEWQKKASLPASTRVGEQTHVNKRVEKSIANILLATASRRTVQVRVTHLLRVARRNQRRIVTANQLQRE